LNEAPSKIELLPGAWLYRLSRFDDQRGSFVKTYQRSALASSGVHFNLAEEFYSISHRNVIRGMHFQRPPYDHVKIVYCPAGAVQDVLLDLRPGSGYGRVADIELSDRHPAFVLIPSGVAHGFRALADASLVVYKTSTEYVPSHDSGVRWDSIGFDWRCPSPVISDRDQHHPPLADLPATF
jgi:dTDP-4-dehydrorhamnose 3,5-epimerase/CDP-3, 6-dideoxy-D-glycero-D-glycero-4-hexulose-5-epimerase